MALSKEQIVAAQAKTLSNMAAARYLHVSYQHYKKWAKLYKLFESHKNQAGVGVPKFLKGSKKMPHMVEIIEGRIAASSFNPNKLNNSLSLSSPGFGVVSNFSPAKIEFAPAIKHIA
mgnify:CR=1 FL=1